jgi:hypothetical protein
MPQEASIRDNMPQKVSTFSLVSAMKCSGSTKLW